MTLGRREEVPTRLVIDDDETTRAGRVIREVILRHNVGTSLCLSVEGIILAVQALLVPPGGVGEVNCM